MVKGLWADKKRPQQKWENYEWEISLVNKKKTYKVVDQPFIKL